MRSSRHSQRHSPFVQNKRSVSNETVEYDYVVVGSGIGGGPVAANLAVAGFKVLLIDAGGDSGEGKAYSQLQYLCVFTDRQQRPRKSSPRYTF